MDSFAFVSPVTSSETGGSIMTRSDPKYCNQIENCLNKADEKFCLGVELLQTKFSLLITVSVVLVGVVLFLLLHRCNWLKIRNIESEVKRTTASSQDRKDSMINHLIQGKFSRYS